MRLDALALWGSLVALAPAARAQVAPRAAEPPGRASSAAAPRAAGGATKPRPAPLSPEDAALVRELALVENAELLKHLELFDARDPAQARGDPAPAVPAPGRPSEAPSR